MRAAVLTAFDGPDGVEVRSVDDPTVDSTDALVRVEACSLNRRDLWMLLGRGGVTEADLPYVLGSDVAGVVTEVGDDVTGIAPGDRAVVSPNRTCGSCHACRADRENRCREFSLADGGLAERVTAPADRLVSLPESVSVAAAAALPVAYVTAWRMIALAGVEPTERVFVPGATGGVGVAAIQLASVLGAETIATSRSREKLDRLADLGATHVIESDDPETVKRNLKDLDRPDVVLDHMGGGFTSVGLKALDHGGRLVSCGSTVDATTEVDLPSLYLGQKTVYGSSMGTQADLETLVRLIASDRLEPAIGGEYALAEVPAAFEAMADRRAFGKLIVRPTD